MALRGWRVDTCTLAGVERRSRALPRQRLSGGRPGARAVESRRTDPTPSQMKKLSHYDAAGSPRMVDVSAKTETRRMARAQAFVRIRPAVLKQLPQNPKGNPLEIVRIAGIAGAKKTSGLIPICQPLISHVDVEVAVEKGGVRISAVAGPAAQTGVEMEAYDVAGSPRMVDVSAKTKTP